MRLSHNINLVNKKVKKSHFFFRNIRKIIMTITGITLSELVTATGKSRHAIEQWLFNHGIEPIFNGSVYPPDTLEKIKDAKRGRPSKPKP
jgi:hypothetical protein